MPLAGAFLHVIVPRSSRHLPFTTLRQIWTVEGENACFIAQRAPTASNKGCTRLPRAALDCCGGVVLHDPLPDVAQAAAVRLVRSFGEKPDAPQKQKQ